jgi:uncharacterized damage-inducible protein DinB
MFTREGVRALHTWTHDRLDLLLEHAAKLPAELYTRELQGFGSASLRAQLVHILASESNWVRRLNNEPKLPFDDANYSSIADIRRLKQEVAGLTAAYIDSLTEEQLNTDLTRRPQGWVGALRSPGFILHHVVTHAFHHKGQVAAMFRQLGHPTGDTDLQREE